MNVATDACTLLRTISVGQVHQPIFASSVGKWQTYAPYIGPMLDALEPLDELT